MELDFVTLDVFTKTRYQGNPLAIVKVPARYKHQLSQAQKQSIAREFNLSETAFLHEGIGSHGPWSVDIFTTTEELPFAGHPTIGAAYYILTLTSGVEKGVLITKSGPLDIGQAANMAVSITISHDVRIHRLSISDLATPSSLLSARSQLAEAELRAPLVSVVKGMTFLLVKLPSLELLGEVQCAPQGLKVHHLLDEGWGEGFISRYYYVLEERGIESVFKVRARMVEATVEDPATGSAACALGCYLAMNGIGTGGDGTVASYEIMQGVEMGRRSMIQVMIELDGNRKGIKRVTLIGSAVKVMEGKLTV